MGIGVLVGPMIGLFAVYLTSLVASGGARYPVTAVWMTVLVAPLAIILGLRNLNEQERSDGVIAALAGQFETQARAAVREPPGQRPRHGRG